MIKPIHLLITLVIGFLAGWLFYSKDDVVLPPSKKMDSLHSVIKQDEKDVMTLQFTLKEKNKELEDAHEQRLMAEKKAHEAEVKYNLAKSLKPITHKDSIVYMQVTAADCDTLNTTMKQLVSYYFDELQKSEGVRTTLKKENEKLVSENKAYAVSDSLHVQTEKALVKKARKNLLKGGLIGVVGGILAVLIL